LQARATLAKPEVRRKPLAWPDRPPAGVGGAARRHDQRECQKGSPARAFTAIVLPWAGPARLTLETAGAAG